MSEDGSDVARQDELLELLYWLEGEGLADNATLPGMARFLAQPEPTVSATLERLLRRGDVAAHDDAGTLTQYRLTEGGRREAARRFAESFAPLLSQGHGECNDPECDCHTSPEGAAACHARTHAGHTHEL